MKNLQDATERICELKGSLVALDALVPAVLQALSAPTRARLMASFDAHAEAARAVMLPADISDLVLATFERDVARNRALLQGSLDARTTGEPATVDELLLTTTRITVFPAARALGNASGFFYRSGKRLFLVSSLQVFADAGSGHHPDRIEIDLRTDPQDMTRHARVSLPLVREGLPQWREARDEGGALDIAALEIPAASLPADAVLQAFDENHLGARGEQVAVGDVLTIAGFPLGLHDTVHHLAVARSATVASAYGVRFRGQGCFLTDVRALPGSSGSPVVRRRLNEGASAPSWQLIGVHSQARDDLPGLSRAWHADVLPALTAAG